MILTSFFDLDGTLSKGLLITEFSKHLVSTNLFPKENYSEIEKWNKLYLEKKVTYRKIAIEKPKIYAFSLKNRAVDDIKREAKVFVEKVKENLLYPYAKELVKLMKKYGMTILISGSPVEVVTLLGEYFHFDLSYGTELEVKREVYTGKLKQNLIIKETKETILEKIIYENKIDLSKSFGFGDTEQDLSFLSKVGNPVALNPNKELLFIAQKNSWMTFNAGDDVINKINEKLKLLENNQIKQS